MFKTKMCFTKFHVCKWNLIMDINLNILKSADLEQGTMALWSNSSCIRSGDPRFESRRGLKNPNFFSYSKG